MRGDVRHPRLPPKPARFAARAGGLTRWTSRSGRRTERSPTRSALRTIGELVADRTPGAQAATAKLYASVQHQRLLELATELLAEDVTGDGYALEPLQRAFLLSRAETIYGGSSQIQRNIIGERILGLPREPRPRERAPGG